MSLKNGLKKRTPIWCWLMIVALAFVVLPGAVAKPTQEEKPQEAEPSVDEPELEQTMQASKSSSDHKDQVNRRMFKGNKFWSNEQLCKNLFSKQSYWNLLGEDFNPDTIPADTKALTNYYRSFGFFDVKVTGCG